MGAGPEAPVPHLLPSSLLPGRSDRRGAGVRISGRPRPRAAGRWPRPVGPVSDACQFGWPEADGSHVRALPPSPAHDPIPPLREGLLI